MIFLVVKAAVFSLCLACKTSGFWYGTSKDHAVCDDQFSLMKTQSTPESAPASSAPPFHLWQLAAEMAASAHIGQTTPESEIPFFSHSARVAMIVAVVFQCHEAEVIAAALMHDVLEKTSLEKTDITAKVGEKVADWVAWLSKNEKQELGGYWKRLAKAPWEARLIKMADALDHLNGPIEYRPERIKAARKALKLATSAEREIELAAAALSKEIQNMEGS